MIEALIQGKFPSKHDQGLKKIVDESNQKFCHYLVLNKKNLVFDHIRPSVNIT